MSQTQHIGIVDWGIGGLSVLKKIVAAENQKANLSRITYFSDSGSKPYGLQSDSELRSRLETIFRFLTSQGATTLVVACNAASTAIMDMTTFEGLPVVNVIAPVLKSIKNVRCKRLGVIGGRRTVDSHIFKSHIEQASAIEVFEQVAQPLSALIEAGHITKDEIFAELEPIMAPLLAQQIDGLLLACTHYPALAPVLKDLYPHVALIDPADFVVSDLRDVLMDVSSGRGPLKTEDFSASYFSTSYFTTGNPVQMRESALKAFQWPIEKVISTLL